MCRANLTITVYDQYKKEHSQKQDGTSLRSALGKAQREDEALSKLIQENVQGKVLTTQELQVLDNFVWKLNNQFKKLQLLAGNLCSRFETGHIEVVLQQIVPPSMTHKFFSACYSYTAAGQLKNKTISFCPEYRKTGNCLSTAVRNVKNVRGRPRNTINHS